MLSAIVHASIRNAKAVAVSLALLILAGIYFAAILPIDAMPDVSTVQVSVLTTSAGLSPEDVERRVTVPLENALNGTPGSTQVRSTSRAGLSAVTVIFHDRMDVWFARQLVLERIRGLEQEFPAGTSTPELAPVSTGLGEIFQFVVRSDQHSAMQLRTLLDWEIVPKLRGVPGVVEVNTMGGELKQFQVVVDGQTLSAHKLTLSDVTSALEAANVNAGGGYVERREESYTVRGEGNLKGIHDIEDVVLHTAPDGTPVLIKHVATVKIGQALRYGVITHAGKGEAVTGIVMMLLGSNSRTVVHAVNERVAEVQRHLPPGVRIETIYDRKDFVDRTVDTVLHNLAEGVLIVTVLLWLFLGTYRGAFAVVLGIPASMSVALIGMHLFGVPGDLMSLGAIDFGFLVDGPIVILEAVIAATAGRQLAGMERRREYARITDGVARPVAFAVAIITLVYVPLLTLEGVEGKMFRPMALTMACALFGALIYSIVFFPAVMSLIVAPAKGHGPKWIEAIGSGYERLVPSFVRWRWPLLAGSTLSLVGAGYVFALGGAEFVPRIFEGDAVVTIRRAPSISLEEAKRLDLETERVLQVFPEVRTTLGMTGRAEVAIDPVGNDNTDVLVTLRPLAEWTSAHDFDALSELFKHRISARVPGTFVSVSQPIEDRTNEMISGSRADVSIQLFGTDLMKLAALADEVGRRVRQISGSGDVRVERILGQPVMRFEADRARMASFGVRTRDAFAVLGAAREGIHVGHVYDGERRFDLRVFKPAASQDLESMGQLRVETSNGESIPLREVTRLSETDGPTAIRREGRKRAVRVDVNLRGRDLVSWVSEAQAAIHRDVKLPSDYRVEWGGQFENFARAQSRLAIVIPVVAAIILGMLLAMFGELRSAFAVFVMVPLSLTGGMLGLVLRGSSFSLPAAVGFIALGGIAVLNGVVMAQAVNRRLLRGERLDTAIQGGASETVRAVLTTGAVAAFGFLPMALAHSAGAEVQRPLATAVIAGMLVGTGLTLLVLPGLFRLMLREHARGNDSSGFGQWASEYPPPNGFPR